MPCNHRSHFRSILIELYWVSYFVFGDKEAGMICSPQANFRCLSRAGLAERDLAVVWCLLAVKLSIVAQHLGNNESIIDEDIIAGIGLNSAM